jgi:hypothetical protein
VMRGSQRPEIFVVMTPRYGDPTNNKNECF